nr:MAG: ORF1 [TTV-like mini virus]
MPPYYRPRFYNNRKRYYRKRWWRLRRRRPRKTIRRRYRNRVRRFKKFFKKRKQKKLKLYQWQPQLIRRCHIKGWLTLFQAGNGRFSNNYAQYQDSIVPEGEPGGGGWGIFCFNLGGLFEQFEKLRNWWTFSNVNMPLFRYLGCRFTFYRSEHTDYIVRYQNFYPMSDSDTKHAEAQPMRLLLTKHKVVVSKKAPNQRKPYKRIRIKPPSQFFNKWFFQREAVNTNFLLLTASACNLNEFSCPSNEPNNNFTFWSLNPRVFLNLNFNDFPETSGYKPNLTYYLWGTTHFQPTKTQPNPAPKDLIYLGQTNLLQEGKEGSHFSSYTEFNKKENWGNPFHEHYINGTNLTWVTNVQPSNIMSQPNSSTPVTNITQMSEPILVKCRYAPNADKGYKTRCYILPNFKNNSFSWNPPDNEQLIHEGYPLWNLFWGWIDWQLKLNLVTQLKQHYVLIFESPHIDPKLPAYLPLDESFKDNHHIYNTDDQPLLADKLSWHPKILYQQQTIDKFCMSGPAAPKSLSKTIQAECKYDFFFKWGGSPSTMESIANPGRQPQFPTSDNIFSTLQIQDPTSDPRHNIYSWDIRGDIITKPAAARILKDYTTEQTLLFPTETTKLNPQPPAKDLQQTIQTLLQTQTTEKEKEKMQELIQQFQFKQQQLRDQLSQLLANQLNL